MSAQHVTDQDFDTEVLQSTIPVLVDFWAPWCGPCQMLGPIIDQLAGELAGTVKVVKVNVDESPQVAGRYTIMSIPTMLVIKAGAVVDQIVGAMPKEQLIRRINQKI
jgi:thioredoxin 1